MHTVLVLEFATSNEPITIDQEKGSNDAVAIRALLEYCRVTFQLSMGNHSHSTPISLIVADGPIPRQLLTWKAQHQTLAAVIFTPKSIARAHPILDVPSGPAGTERFQT